MDRHGARGPDWYDSIWLNAFFAAQDVVRAICPARLDEFVRAFDPLRTSPEFVARHLPQAIDRNMLQRILEIVRSIPRETYELHEMQRFGRFVVHDHPLIDRIQAELTAHVSDLAGEALEPSYNFLSFYTRLARCEPHLDAPSAKWTFDICLDQSDPWPIHFSAIEPWPESAASASAQDIVADPDREFTTVSMEPGDAILFSGSSQWHYRDALPKDGRKRFCDLLFLHFIPLGTRRLVKPAEWPDLFGIPELAEIPGLAQAG